MIKYSEPIIKSVNNAIERFYPHLFTIEKNMTKTFDGISRMVMLDRYAQKDITNKTIAIGDLVLTIIREDEKFPTRGIGYITAIKNNVVSIELEKEYLYSASDQVNGIIKRKLSQVDKPIEIYFEQIAKRVSNNLCDDESSKIEIYNEITNLNIVPAGRILFGAGSNNTVTYFNCFVMPFIHDSREGISNHRKQVMEIMSRGGGVGTNGSTLRPKNSLAKGVSGRSSGAVSWLNDLASLTNLVEQGGSRRGAQMIMLADWHPDVIEFIISKMQNPKILRFLINTLNDPDIKNLASQKLKFEPLTDSEVDMYQTIVDLAETPGSFTEEHIDNAKLLLQEGGRYSVETSEFLAGANISVAITKDFMDAVANDADYELQFPDIDSYNASEKKIYNDEWHKIGDIREWKKLGHKIKTHKTISAKELWNLINICATYSAEPGIFFIDNANDMTNAVGYDQKVVCTNPCGEQPLAPYSVCNLAAINLANIINKDNGVIDWNKFKNTIETAVLMQDNVIDKTYYFLEENKTQALGERRIGLGIMGLHDLLIWSKLRYGSAESIQLIDKLFEFMATTAYRASIERAKIKGPFPFLITKGSRKKLLTSGYLQKMPDEIRADINKYGIRNSHLLTIAPTGSTGTMVGVSTGLEPYFAYKYFRSGRLGKFMEVNTPIVEEFVRKNNKYTSDNLPSYFVSAGNLTPNEHVNIQCTIQNWVDSSISKTVNAPKNYTVTDVENIYFRLYKNGAKGGTVYVDGSRETQVLSLSKSDKTEQIDLIDTYGIEVTTKKTDIRVDKSPNPKPLKADRQDREVGVDIGDICPICFEGTIVNAGGCNTCNNCNAQLKCEI